jgi:hypothetical protein
MRILTRQLGVVSPERMFLTESFCETCDGTEMTLPQALRSKQRRDVFYLASEKTPDPNGT